MKKILFVTLCLILAVQVGAQNENSKSYNSKCDFEVNQYLQIYKQQGAAEASKAFNEESGQNVVSLVVNCYNVEETQKALDAMGISSRPIVGHVLTALISPDAIETVANLPSVKRLTGLKKKYMTMNKARAAVAADSVQSGINLETPFTGKGVVIGVIDQGFEYDHPAFRVTKDSTRIQAVWNLYKSSSATPITGSANIIAAGSDASNESHATHVSGIAAGGKVMGSSTYYGIAPDAHIVMVASKNFEDAEILNGVSYIKSVAEKLGEPWVVNMSFGANSCAHDGTSDLSLSLDTFSQEGGHLIVSAGNSGNDYLHSSYDFTQDKDTCYLIIRHNSEDPYIYLVGSDATTINVSRPVLYNSTTAKTTSITDAVWKKLVNNGYVIEAVDGNNNRYTFNAYLPLSSILPSGVTDKSIYYVCFPVTAKKGCHFDAFLETNGPEFYGYVGNFNYAPYDAEMCVCTPADTRSAIAVGAYVTKTSYVDLDKRTQRYTSGTLKDLAYFSSVGPSSNSTLLKPDVCAPGMGIASSVVKSSSEYASSNSAWVEIDSLNGTPYYYGMMSGTSMACPVVTGIVALWLQANPNLTHDDILNIIKASSSQDLYTGTCWNTRWGYGKINAYKGLKLALKLNSIQTARNTEHPVSIQKTDKEWSILFNNGESFAHISVYSLDGRQMQNYNLKNLSAGDEQVVSFSGMTSGVYVVNIQTQNSNISRKVVVK